MKNIKTLFITLIFNSVVMAQLPTNSFFEFEFTGGSLNNTSTSGAPNFSGSITAIADRNASINDAADITGALGGASVGATNVNEMTLSFWMKHSPISSNERILQIYGTAGRGFRLQMTGSQLLYNATVGGVNSSSISNVETATVNIDNSAWHHIVIRTTLINSHTIEYDIFLDNVLVPNLSNTTLDIEDYQNGLSITNFLSSANLVVSPTNNYSGDIDDLYFYKSALTDAQITQLYNYSPPPCTVNIPDANFKAYLVGNTAINTNGDTEIQCSEASAFTGGIFANNLSISDLTGVEAFTSLVGLHCTNNSITTIDISTNTLLQGLKCSDNQISSISTVNNPLLSLLYCHNNLITSLDLTTNPSLQYVHCYNNQISTMSLPQSATLEEISAGDNNLTAIDVSFNTGLELLELDQNQISTIDLSQNTLLEKLYVRNNLFTSLDCSNNSSLNWIVINDNPNMQTFDISHGNNTIISFFWAHNSPNLTCIQVDDVAYSTTNWTSSSFNFDAASSFSLNCGVAPCLVTIPDANFKAYLVGNTAINTNGNIEIECSEASAFTGPMYATGMGITNLTGIEAFTGVNILHIGGNLLTSVDLSQNTILSILKCSQNQLSTLDLSTHPLLYNLDASQNLITTIDLTANSGLAELNLTLNQISSIDLSNLVDLTILKIADNNLSNLALTSNVALQELICKGNQIVSLDISGLPVFAKMRCDDNSLTSLNLANGNNSNYSYMIAGTNPDLTCIQVDNVGYSTTNWTDVDVQTSFSTNCTGNVGIKLIAINNINIYPNPVQNELFIELDNQEVTNITIIDYSGRVVQVMTNNTANSIDVSNLTQGIYILKISTKEGVFTNRFIKQ